MDKISLTDPRAWAGVGALVFFVFVLIFAYHHSIYLFTTAPAA